ncbi:MAG: hypothetical protein VX626_00830 [Candidatus Thermoplasmatota archaeon]|jgi:hypothetical protein|nr:hypothetical protein [Candidatus Thermoplasmatota archaeon]|tara:strand:- start:1266 stop:1535 length:270 start_codon:yes stop_codon:yes gene_type:complete
MPAGDEDNIVDKAIGNPAFDQLFGYHIFFRRAAIPVLLFLIGILSYTMLESLFSFSSDTTLTISFVIVGLSLGPILNLERYMGVLFSRK